MFTLRMCVCIMCVNIMCVRYMCAHAKGGWGLVVCLLQLLFPLCFETVFRRSWNWSHQFNKTGWKQVPNILGLCLSLYRLHQCWLHGVVFTWVSEPGSSLHVCVAITSFTETSPLLMLESIPLPFFPPPPLHPPFLHPRPPLLFLPSSVIFSSPCFRLEYLKQTSDIVLSTCKYQCTATSKQIR